MKRTVAFCLAFLVMLAGSVAPAEMVTIYAPDGRTANVLKEDVSAYLSVGWYGAYEEIIQTIYAPDGRRADVYLADLPAYLSSGWYKTYEETVQTLYSIDGRQIVVYRTEVPSYLSLGWYATIEETVQALYAPDNKTITVYKSEVPAYLACGWTTSKDAGVIALTFDDGPHGVYTHTILDTLKTYGAKATFFTLGSQVNVHPSVVKRAKEIGCGIGSHSYSHPNLAASSGSKIQNEIRSTVSAVQNATGSAPTLFRPPYGNHTATVRSQAGVPLILWNVDTRDWESRNAQAVVQHVLSYASDGDIILMHDIYASTAEAVKILVPALIKRGFRLVTVSELAKEKGMYLEAGKTYYGF